MFNLNWLNGWQRLWLVSGIIYLFIVIYFAFVNFPNCSAIADKMVQTFMYYFPSANNTNISDYKMSAFSTIDDTEITYKIYTIGDTIRKAVEAKKLGNPLTSSEEELYTAWTTSHSTIDTLLFTSSTAMLFHEYQACESISTLGKFVMVYMAFLSWIVPLILVYIFGWALGWVYRGFKKNHMN